MDMNKKQKAMLQRGKLDSNTGKSSGVKSDSEVLNEGKNQIKKSLMAFDNATKASTVHQAVEQYNNMLVEDMKHDNLLKEATSVHPVERNGNIGVRVGNFDVFPEKTTSGKTRYTVADTNNGVPIYEQLYLSSNAEAMVKLLSRGYSKYSPEIKHILELEQKYDKHYKDALHFQKKSKSQGRDQLLETCFEESKHQAILVREESKKYLNRLS